MSERHILSNDFRDNAACTIVWKSVFVMYNKSCVFHEKLQNCLLSQTILYNYILCESNSDLDVPNIWSLNLKTG